MDGKDTVKKKALIFGAGKIGRGFIAHLLHVSDYSVSFVDVQETVINHMREYKAYPVNILGAEDKNATIPVEAAWLLSDMDEVSGAVAESDIIFASVGGQNLALLGPVLAKGLEKRFSENPEADLNIVVCENYHKPAQIVRNAVLERLEPRYHDAFNEHVGIAETQIQRSVIEPTEEMVREHPLSLKAQDWWVLPVDADALKKPLPEVTGMKFIENFANALQRKLFTYNATNAVVCYLGYLKGHELLADAALDEEIIGITHRSWNESNPAIVKLLGYTDDEQKEFAEAAMGKYQKREIVDPIERNARDPLRKLGRNDRLVGPACMAMEAGINPEVYAYVIAAALYYDHPDDPRAQTLQQMIREKGVAAVLETVCGLPAGNELHKMILKRYPEFANVKKTGKLPQC